MVLSSEREILMNEVGLDLFQTEAGTFKLIDTAEQADFTPHD